MNCRMILVSCMMMVIFISQIGTCASGESSNSGLAVKFETAYQNWVEARNKWVREHPAASFNPLLPEERTLLDMGPRVFPFLIEKCEKDIKEPHWDNHFRSDLFGIITGLTAKHFAKEDRPNGKVVDQKSEIGLFVKWWKEDRKDTPKKFALLTTKWEASERLGKTAYSLEFFDQIQAMGYDVLPLIMEKIKVGDTRFIPAVRNIMRDQTIGGDKPTAESILKWWEQNKAKLTLPPAQSAH